MRRLVYAPRAYAFIKTSDGQIRDVSKYIVSGNVHRVLQQVSSAELTLRNPKMIFTTPDESNKVAFYPMDPIVIYLKRVRGKPIRLFTGFLDRTPYLALYPGTVTLRASCTLKRLLYTFFDPALPYTQTFLSKYGWINRGDGTAYSASAWGDGGTARRDTSGKVLVVGDSLGVGTVPGLKNAIGDSNVDADVKVGRTSTEALAILQSKLASGVSYSYIVFDVGTNDSSASVTQASAVAAVAAAKGIPVLMMTLNGPNATAKNNVIRTAAGVTVVDWATPSDQYIKSDPQHIHPDPAGYRARAKLIASNLVTTTEAQDDTSQSTSVNSGSFSNLLYATLKEIGLWDPESILIERLPDDIFARMAELYAQITSEQTALKTQVEDLFHNILGDGDHGGATTGDVDLSNINGDVPTVVYKTGVKLKASQKHLLAAMETGLVEAPIDNGKSFGNPNYGDSTSTGWRQELATPDHPDPMNVPHSAERFFNECNQLDKGQTAGQLAADVQRPREDLRGRYEEVRATAATLLRKIAEQVSKDGSDATTFGSPDLGGFPSSANNDTTSTTQSQGSTKKDTSSTELYSPLKNLSVGSIGQGGGAYGAGRSYGGHAGVDMPADYGQQLSSITDGVVTYVGPWSGGAEGQLVVIRVTQKVKNYPDNIRLGYGHMSAITVKKGDTVKAGDPIGAAGHGSNGQNHLHLFVRQDDQPANGTMDPTPLAKAAAQGAQPSGGPGAGGPGDTATSGADSATDVTNFGAGAAFAATINFPTLMESIEAVGLQGEKSLMNDKPLMPFIQELCESSLREFQSMPDGSFFAFYPDYFGEFYHRPPYWEIDDIEILDGGVELSDDALTTHYYVVGDTTWSGDQQFNNLMSAGVVTVFNAFMANGMLTQNTEKPKTTKKGKEKGPSDLLLSADEAIEFLNRYGARPQVDDVPMIHSPYFEMFLAYQRFMISWSKQFSTPFTFTFMPELYPGGKVGFPDHGLQMYIEEVTHTFDYTSGFTTQATLSAPSVYTAKGAKLPTNLPPNMVKAIIQPAIAPDNEVEGKDFGLTDDGATLKATDNHQTVAVNTP